MKDGLSSLLRASTKAAPPEWLDTLISERAVGVVQKEADEASRRARRSGPLGLLRRVAATMREAAARVRSATGPHLGAARPAVHTSPGPL